MVPVESLALRRTATQSPDRRQLMTTAGVMEQTPGMLGLKFTLSGTDPIDVIELDRDSSGSQTVGGMSSKGCRPRIVPPQLTQIIHATCLR